MADEKPAKKSDTITHRVKAGTNFKPHVEGDLVELTPAQAVAWADLFDRVDPKA